MQELLRYARTAHPLSIKILNFSSSVTDNELMSSERMNEERRLRSKQVQCLIYDEFDAKSMAVCISYVRNFISLSFHLNFFLSLLNLIFTMTFIAVTAQTDNYGCIDKFLLLHQCRAVLGV